MKSAPLSRLAVCFLPETLDLDDLLSFFEDDSDLVPFTREADGSGATARGPHWEVRMTVDATRAAIEREMAGLASRTDEAGRGKTVVTIDCACEAAAESALVPSRGMWVPASTIVDPAGHVPNAAVTACEILNELDGAIVYDVMLKQFYPST